MRIKILQFFLMFNNQSYGIFSVFCLVLLFSCSENESDRLEDVSSEVVINFSSYDYKIAEHDWLRIDTILFVHTEYEKFYSNNLVTGDSIFIPGHRIWVDKNGTNVMTTRIGGMPIVEAIRMYLLSLKTKDGKNIYKISTQATLPGKIIISRVDQKPLKIESSSKDYLKMLEKPS